MILNIVLQSQGVFFHPLPGFSIKNSHGQRLFGDNPCEVTLKVPILSAGGYPISVGLADGARVGPGTHHSLQGALVFRPTSSPARRRGGLLGPPRLETRLAGQPIREDIGMTTAEKNDRHAHV